MSNFALDTFSGSSGTNLSAHSANTGGAWTKIGSAGNVFLGGSGTVYFDTTDFVLYNLQSATPPSADYEVSIQNKFWSVGSTSAGPFVAARSTSGGDMYFFGFSASSAPYTTVDEVHLFKRVSGGYTSLGAAAFTPTIGVTYTVKIRVSGTSIKGYVDGTELVSATDSSLTAAGFVGIMGAGSQTATTGFDGRNFSADTLSSALASGTISVTGQTASSITLANTGASGGTPAYSYQWHRSTTNGFTPSVGNAISGATSATLTDTGLSASTTYYYKLVTTDSASASVTSNQASGTTSAPSALVSGTATATASTNSQINASVAAASGGTPAYSYQWYRSTTAAFTPGAGNLLSGATSQTLADVTASTGTIYYYKCVVTDAASATATSNQIIGNLWGPVVKLGYIGDSITAGGAGNLVPTILPKLRTQRQVPVNDNQGIGGTTSADWLPGSGNLNGAKSSFATNGVTHVCLCLGVNDSKILVATSPSAYASNISSTAANLVASGMVVILHAPSYVVPGSYGEWNEASNGLIKQYGDALAGVANGSTILLGDTLSFSYFGEHVAELSDGVHPNSTGYNTFSYLWAAAIDRALNPSVASTQRSWIA